MNYNKMMIKRDKVVPFIEMLAKAYNDQDDEYIVLTTEQLWFVLIKEEDR